MVLNAFHIWIYQGDNSAYNKTLLILCNITETEYEAWTKFMAGNGKTKMHLRNTLGLYKSKVSTLGGKK